MPSSFKEYHGICVEDRALGSREIKVFVRELVPYSAGSIKDTTRNETYSIKDENGAIISGQASTTNNIIADYLGEDTNRFFPPDVVKGEQVKVYQYADEDKWYWTSLGRDDNLRRGEIIRWAASNDMAQNKQLSESNTYFIEIDTKVAGRLRIHTSKSNGEPFGYDINIEAMQGFAQITDDVGNRIELNSVETDIKVVNKEGTMVDLNKQDIMMVAPQNILLRAGSTLVMTAPQIIRKGNVQSTGNIDSIGNIENTGNISNSGSIGGNGINSAGTITSTGNVTAPLFIGNLQGSDND